MAIVWIDPGHGGRDPGATGNGLQEKDVVLSLSTAIKRKLEAEYDGIQVLLSRESDIFLELPARTDAANRARANILVSIHCNAGGGNGGFESYRYTTASSATVKLHDTVHAEIIKALAPFGVLDRGVKAKNLHMLRESSMPAILTENLFVDVPSDASKLKNTEVMNAIVNGHAAGIAKYLGLTPKRGTLNMDKAKVLAYGKEIKDGLIINNTVYVPLRALAEASGDRVTWDNRTKTATVTKSE